MLINSAFSIIIPTKRLPMGSFYYMLQEMDDSQITIKELTNELLGRLHTDIYAQVLELTADAGLPRDLEKLIRDEGIKKLKLSE